MLDISPAIKTCFNALLVKKAIPVKCHYGYRKWLRYYLDFCRKYHLGGSPAFHQEITGEKSNDNGSKKPA